MVILKNQNSHLDRRRALAVSLAVIASAAMPVALNASKTATRVLFVCQFGTAKSAIARELLRRRATQRGIRVIVTSRGITPEPHLAISTRDHLLADGIIVDGEAVRPLQNADLRAADLVVVFNPLPASMHARVLRDWSAVPSVNDAYPLARADLDSRVELLLDDMVRMRR